MEIHMKNIFTAIAVSTLMISGVAIAAEHDTAAQGSNTMTSTTPAQPDYQADFHRLDTNKDGYLEKSEVTSDPLLGKHFNKIAANGRLGESKYAAWEAKHHRKHPARK
jgi:hypothetical protein